MSLRVTKLYLTGPDFCPLHPLAVGNVTRADVAAAVRAIVGKHSASTAAAARRALSAFFAWAIAEGSGQPSRGSFCPDYPAARDRVLSNDELVAIWRASQADDFGRIVRLLIREAAGAKRSAECGVAKSTSTQGDGGATGIAEQRTNAHTRSRCRRRHWTSFGLYRWRMRDNLFGDRAEVGFTNWSTGKRQLDHRLAGVVKAWLCCMIFEEPSRPAWPTSVSSRTTSKPRPTTSVAIGAGSPAPTIGACYERAVAGSAGAMGGPCRAAGERQEAGHRGEAAQAARQ